MSASAVAYSYSDPSTTDRSWAPCVSFPEELVLGDQDLCFAYSYSPMLE